jgi:major membrane immunogen (membrane-anchored lipoprotein)
MVFKIGTAPAGSPDHQSSRSSPGPGRNGAKPESPPAWAALALAAFLLFPTACAPGPPPGTPGLKDGYYTAEAAAFDDQGWKEYLTIYVFNGRIVSAEYDSRNSRGFIRSWDMADKRRSTLATGTNQSKYSREYAEALLNRQDPAQITPAPGASQVLPNFQGLAEEAMKQARVGNPGVALVRLKDRP